VAGAFPCEKLLREEAILNFTAVCSQHWTEKILIRNLITANKDRAMYPDRSARFLTWSIWHSTLQPFRPIANRDDLGLCELSIRPPWGILKKVMQAAIRE
jgi:hypothetical protein